MKKKECSHPKESVVPFERQARFQATWCRHACGIAQSRVPSDEMLLESNQLKPSGTAHPFAVGRNKEPRDFVLAERRVAGFNALSRVDSASTVPPRTAENLADAQNAVKN